MAFIKPGTRRSGDGRAKRLLKTTSASQRALQIVILGGMIGLAALLIRNLLDNLNAAGLQLSFDFLAGASGFDVNESLIPYDADSSYFAALVVGALNTLHLALVCIIFSTILGVFVGALRLSGIRILGVACRLYVESLRNLPKLLVLLAVYVLLVVELPAAREAISFFDLAFLSNRGLNLPSLAFDAGQMFPTRSVILSVAYFAICAGLWTGLKGWLVGRWLRIYLPAALVALGWSVMSGVVTLEAPEFVGFNFAGGSVVSLPFLALAIALSLYHGAQVAEVVRSGIQSVPKGQTDAGSALGLSGAQAFWLIICPQALRTMVPPLTNQYFNILKNTSIGLAVGYSDLVSIMSTSINQTFRPVELMLLTVAVYLTIGVVVSVLLNLFNRRVQLKGS